MPSLLDKLWARLSDDAKLAIKWIAAEYNYLAELKDDIVVIEKEEDLAEEEKAAKKAKRALKYVGFTERKTHKDVIEVIEDLKEVIARYPQLASLEKEIEVSSEQLLKAFSLYAGELRDKLNELSTQLELLEREKKKQKAEIIRQEILENARNLEEHLDVLIKWTQGLEASLEKVEKVAIKGKASKKFRASLIAALPINERLIIELVKGKLKPASYVIFGGFRLSSAYDIEMKGVYVVKFEGKGAVPIKEDIVQAFEEELTSEGIFFQRISKEHVPTYDLQQRQVLLETVFYSIGKNAGSLRKLVAAKTGYEKGFALGYPTDAVESYDKVIDGEKRDGTYFNRSLGNAVKAGVEIPLWIAYISHVPKYFDIVGKNISKSSERLGKRYQAHIRKINSELAAKIEAEFKRRCKPDAPDGFIHYAR